MGERIWEGNEGRKKHRKEERLPRRKSRVKMKIRNKNKEVKGTRRRKQEE